MPIKSKDTIRRGRNFVFLFEKVRTLIKREIPLKRIQAPIMNLIICSTILEAKIKINDIAIRAIPLPKSIGWFSPSFLFFK